MLEIRCVSSKTADIFFVICHNGDEKKVILLDGGLQGDYSEFKASVKDALESYSAIDLLIITHVDNDHIGGIPTLIKEDFISSDTLKKVLFNYPENIAPLKERATATQNKLNVTFEQGNQVITELKRKNIEIDGCSFSSETPFISLGRNKLYVLSPTIEGLGKLKIKWIKDNTKVSHYNDKDLTPETLDKITFKEDREPANGSSIAVLIVDESGNKVLMAADAFPTTMLKNAATIWSEGVDVDLIKVSHHGSHKNTSNDFLKFFPCRNYLFATGVDPRLPHKKVLRLISQVHKGSQIICANQSWFFDEKYRDELTGYGLVLKHIPKRILVVDNHDIKFD
jgi:beta-lactamase superfamily II metal-dependent hydrolase